MGNEQNLLQAEAELESSLHGTYAFEKFLETKGYRKPQVSELLGSDPILDLGSPQANGGSGILSTLEWLNWWLPGSQT